MVSNFGYIKSTAGTLKLATIGGVALVVILGFISYFGSEYTHNREEYAHLFTGNELRSLWRELYLLGGSILCLLFSSLNLLLHCQSVEFYWNKRTAIFDFFYHVLGFIVLSTAGVLFIVSAVKVYEINCTTDNGCQEFEIKLAAGGFSTITSILFMTVGVIVLTNRKDVERDRMVLSPTKNDIQKY